jgi:hypothetical protein
MKINKKSVIYAIAVIVIGTFLFSANYIFNDLIKTSKEARIADIRLPSETQIIKFNIGEVKKTKLMWKDALVIRGWVYKTNGNYAKREVCLVLKSDNDTIIYRIKNENLVSRPDVSAYFHSEGGVNSHGFELFLPLHRLKGNAYKIGFVIEDETGKYYSVSNDVLNISGESVSVIKVGPDPASLSFKTPLNFKKTTKEVTCYFDTVSNSGKYLTINGWGFLKGMDANAMQSYILLKKNENVIAFNVRIKMRKDVTRFFEKSKLNLDSCGFQAIISTETLEKGKYLLGMYICKGDQVGIIFTNKEISIEK